MLGLAVVGAVVGVAGRLLHPAGRVVTVPTALWLGVLGALAAFYGGRAAHLFTDGQIFGWAAAMAGAALLVAVWGVARPRR
ncbi:hypothetical protein D9X30_2985 [Cupriavidus sp. U2]|uniref:hypothetical protein n=1 Tax=Cupriavidus sp. U2 TaxID=2920269 RepID=UPI00129D41A9|nr:hypothetical protein [Cupriavidus sp. U2]KAI3591929.1 hypothetical protein D9X30_2985 [Cupriavidus sp. U2]